MPYQIQRGDTIAGVTKLMNMSWDTLRRLNPHAVSQSSRTGRWFLKEGVEIRGEDKFDTLVKRAEEGEKPPPATETKEVSKGWTEYTIKPGDTLWALAVKRFHVDVEELMRANNIDDPKKLRPGQKIRVQLPSYPEKLDVVASWYGQDHHGRPMANGAFFNMYADTIAHRDLPLGTRVELENQETGERARAVVTDRGPYVTGRDVDLSYGLAQKLSLVEKGVGSLVMRILG